MMKRIFKKFLSVALVALMCAACITPLTACDPPVEPLSMLKTDGELIKNENGTGEVVYLRGVNAGGLFVLEQWMTGFRNSTDHRTTTKLFIERFGEEETKELWSVYQSNWWSDVDFQNCADMGMNVIRLPFSYMNVDFDAILDYENAGQNYDFTALDNFVEKAAEYGMYTILDLHGAYGSQNGQDHSGEVIGNAADVDFYTNEKMQNLTADLWRALAEHYKDNPNVAGYDLLNEPGEKGGSTSDKHWKVLDKFYDAVREVDEDHIVIFESCWEGKNLPQPSVYGWENCMYSFHHYTGNSDYAGHSSSMNTRISDVTSQNFGVPIQMGEFSCYTNDESWDYTLEALNRNGWHWTTWTYKLNGTGYGGWGIVYTEAEKVDANVDDYDTILEKWEDIRTTENTKLGTFSSGRTLYDIIKKYCTQTTLEAEKVLVADGSYVMQDAIQSGFYLSIGEKVGNYAALTQGNGSQETITVSNHKDGDGSVYLKTSQGNLGVYNYNDAIYVGVLSISSNATRFFPLQLSDGAYIFLSYTTCRYLRFDEETGTVKADATSVKDALKLTF